MNRVPADRRLAGPAQRASWTPASGPAPRAGIGVDSARPGLPRRRSWPAGREPGPAAAIPAELSDPTRSLVTPREV